MVAYEREGTYNNLTEISVLGDREDEKV